MLSDAKSCLRPESAPLSFGRSSATKCVLLNNEPCMTRPTLIDLNPVEVNFYPFMISLDKCNGICNTVDNLSMKICFPSEKMLKCLNVKIFNKITSIYEPKTLVKHISCDCKCKFNSTIYNPNQKWNNDICQCECKNYNKSKKYYIWNLSKYLKIIADDSKTVCDEI